jgi:hypothetical protein
MRPLFTFLFLFCLAACHRPEQVMKRALAPHRAPDFIMMANHHEKTVFGSDTVVSCTTALDVVPLARYPVLFRLDSDAVDEPRHAFSAQLYFPSAVCKKDKAMMQAMRKVFDRLISDHRPDVTINPDSLQDYYNNATSLEVWVTGFRLSPRLISITFTYQSYTWGAAHYNHGQLSFNYDRIRKKQFRLSDIFKVNATADKVNFCKAAYGDRWPETEVEYGYQTIQPEDLENETDFTCTDSALVFLFDDYDRGPGMTEITLPLAGITKCMTGYGRKLLLK